MKIAVIIILSFVSVQLHAQNRSDSSMACMKLNKALLKNITPPEFPGGEAAWRKWLEKSMDSDFGIPDSTDGEDHTYRCYFTVDTTGAISNVGFCGAKNNIIENNLREMILRSPLWKPAVNARGTKVRYVKLQVLMFHPVSQ